MLNSIKKTLHVFDKISRKETEWLIAKVEMYEKMEMVEQKHLKIHEKDIENKTILRCANVADGLTGKYYETGDTEPVWRNPSAKDAARAIRSVIK